ncbi:response regulator [Celerinatantimonas diazotrophica]|uniref:Response regulator receiver domain-containing protein n=1 Tax=Celerinatantimonas diazotrophica TaxID=412034 RepID=A0A4V2PNI9_9GAMM|nr:response regulator [Celerinatantimonas diazotrophica]TCK47251.1 response regulator receiver domain-containing protein [Celerinatantimonas diazotrophica]CAG9296023.1 Protein-glutamate methylesterase/protein-glutamine glutaminase [Celerinatantimonas diazotrophica]
MNNTQSNSDDWFEDSAHCYQLLHIEDNMADQILVQEVLEQRNEMHYDLTQIANITQAKQLLAQPSCPQFDIILLDLNLPDSQGLNSLTNVLKLYPGTPIIVLTGYENNALGLKAISMGADDYLSKSQVTHANLLVKTIQYAIARSHHPAQSHSEQPQKSASDNNYYLSKDTDDDKPLRNTAPDLFAELCKIQQELIVLYADSEKTSEDNELIENLIKTIIRQLGDVHADPSDLIDLNKTALATRCLDESPIRAVQLKENNRELLLNMLTQLSLWYSQET